MRPVGTTSSDPITTVRPGTAPSRCESLAAASMSNASTQSTPAALAWFDAARRRSVMRMSLVTGPAFCDRPVWSRPRTSKPSSIAAVPMIWLTVIDAGAADPRQPHREAVGVDDRHRRRERSAGGVGLAASGAARVCRRSVTVANDGQSPRMHEKS